MFDNFIAEIQAAGRITIPNLIRRLRKLRQGDKLNVRIEKIKED